MKFRNKSIIIGLFIFSFSLSGCLKWATRAYDKYPKKTALDKTYNYKGKIIIVGAGASGLAAAKILEQNSIDYTILEATDRYGGRLKKDTTLADFPIDIGAEWIHSFPQILNKLKGKEGDEVDEELVPYHLEEAYNWDGKNYEEVSQSELDKSFNFMPESKFKNSTWYDFVDENLAKDVKHKIRFNSPVTEINYQGNQVLVKTKNGKVYKADKVLVTVSMGVLKSNMINFVPEFSQEKKKAIESIDFHRGFKLMMKFSDKFYPDAINCKVKTGEKVFYDVAFKKGAKDHIFGLLATGKSAEDYYKLGSDQAIVSSVIKELDLIFNGKASATFTGEFVLENWGQHEFTLGTWTEAFRSKKSTIKILNQSLGKEIYFAGEIYDIYQQMGVPGAIVSGYHSIDKLLTDKE